MVNAATNSTVITKASSRSNVLGNPDAKISLSKQDRLPTLPEKMDIINKWFASQAKGKQFKQVEYNVEIVSEILVSKQLVSDKDTGIKAIMKSLNIREQDLDMTFNYALF